MRKNTRDGVRIFGLSVGAAIASVVAVLLIAIVAVYASGFFTDVTADRRGETSKKEQVEANGSYRIAAYDRFYDLCASIQATEDKIDNQAALAKTADKADKQRIQYGIGALQNQRAEAIRQYNADARKSYTSGQFRASDLPFQIDPTQEHTSCDA